MEFLEVLKVYVLIQFLILINIFFWWTNSQIANVIKKSFSFYESFCQKIVNSKSQENFVEHKMVLKSGPLDNLR